MADPVTRLTVWYDGACPLCIREIALMRRLDWRRAIEFVDLAPNDASCPIDRQLMLQRFHAQAVGGPILSGAAAFAAMWRVVPLLKPLGLVARAPFVLKLLEMLYLKFLKIRPKLQRFFSAS
jgi:predicted DCC family thiol-disulfide oxidoreductase YuxK